MRRVQPQQPKTRKQRRPYNPVDPLEPAAGWIIVRADEQDNPDWLVGAN